MNFRVIIFEELDGGSHDSRKVTFRSSCLNEDCELNSSGERVIVVFKSRIDRSDFCITKSFSFWNDE